MLSAGQETAKKENTVTAPSHCAAVPRRNRLVRFLALIGLVNLSFLGGAAVMFFELPPSSFLRQAFIGGTAWYEVRQTTQPGLQEHHPLTAAGRIDKPDKTCDGFTLCMYGGGSRAVLVNMRGDVVHHWHVPFSKLWTNPPHLHGPFNDAAIYFNDGHIYPNGDLLVVIEGPIDLRNSSNGFGLAKLDKDSRILWKYAEKCHHDVAVGDDGTIYAIANEVLNTVPAGLKNIPTPCLVDVLHLISPQGTTIKKISLLEAFLDTPYAPLLGAFESPKKFGSVGKSSPYSQTEQNRDVLHTNAVKVLTPALAAKFPMFKPGQILFCPRHLDAIAVLDPDSGKVVWAARGPWHAQHDPSFLDNGHLLLFDNLGSSGGSRVLEYDLTAQSFPWIYPGEHGKPFLSRIRGMCQRLPNGNTLIVGSDAGEAFEVTRDQEVVWSCSTGGAELNRARRYTPDQLPFLKGVQRARP